MGEDVEWIHLAPHDNKRFVFQNKCKCLELGSLKSAAS